MRRVLLKMSGEAVVDSDDDSVISVERLDNFSLQVAHAIEDDPDLQVSIVVGAGNILRGKTLRGVARTKADHMGMLATVINALALQDALTRFDLPSRVLTGIEMPRVAEPYIHGRAIRHLEKGRVVIFGGGTGNPYFTTDTGAALRAAEIEATILLLAKFGTDGIYDRDPRSELGYQAKKFPVITYDEIIARNLEVMDLTAVIMCRDNNVPIYVFDMDAPGGVRNALTGDTSAGTLVQKQLTSPT